MTPSPKKQHYQPLHQAWLDGTDRPPQPPQSQYPPPDAPHVNNHHDVEGGSWGGMTRPEDRTISLMQPLVRSLIQPVVRSSTSSAWRSHDGNTYGNSMYDAADTSNMHDPLLMSSSQQHSNDTKMSAVKIHTHHHHHNDSTMPAEEQNRRRKNNTNKTVRFHSDISVTTGTSHESAMSQHQHQHQYHHHQLRQRNSTGTTSTSGGTCAVPTATTSSTYGERLLNRTYSNTSRGDSRSNSLWNVQYIHKSCHSTTPPEQASRDTIVDPYHDDVDHHLADDVVDDNDDDDLRYRQEDPPHNTTTRNHRNRRNTMRLSTGAGRGGCYEFWNTWFYTLAYQRTVVLILILFTTYTGIVLFYATIYYTMSRMGQAIHNHPSTHPTSPTTATTITTTTLRDDQYYDPNALTTMTSSNLTRNMTGHTTEFINHSLSALLLYLFCDMDLHTPMEAVFFSLSTMASIGYGVSDYYFGNCGVVPLFTVLLQICTAICYDAIAIGLLFQRLRRSHKRSKSIAFTNTAVVQRIQTIPYLMIRVAELRRYPLVNATIRAYCIYHDRYPIPSVGSTLVNTISNDNTTDNELTTFSNPTVTPNANHIRTTYYVTKPMLLLQHNILMNIPQVIVHPIRRSESPLCPPSVWYDANGTPNKYQRPSHDSYTGTTADKHHATNHDWMNEDTEQIQRYVQDRNMEIILVIEGTDELTGTCTQTKQSYTYQDIQWNHQFVPCMYPAHINNEHAITTSHTPSQNPFGGGSGGIIDFASFHAVEPAPVNSEFCPYVPYEPTHEMIP